MRTKTFCEVHGERFLVLLNTLTDTTFCPKCKKKLIGNPFDRPDAFVLLLRALELIESVNTKQS